MSCQGSMASALARRSMLSIDTLRSPLSMPPMYVRSISHRSANASWVRPFSALVRRRLVASISRREPGCDRFTRAAGASDDHKATDFKYHSVLPTSTSRSTTSDERRGRSGHRRLDARRGKAELVRGTRAAAAGSRLGFERTRSEEFQDASRAIWRIPANAALTPPFRTGGKSRPGAEARAHMKLRHRPACSMFSSRAIGVQAGCDAASVDPLRRDAILIMPGWPAR